jgi:exodeoxyribonuclease V alpha subunit
MSIRNVELCDVILRRPEIGTYQNGTIFVKLQVWDEEANKDYIAVGNLLPRAVRHGIILKLEGDHVNDPNYGEQFKFTSYQIPRPNGRIGTLAFLQQAPGVGSRTAEAIWCCFGENSIDKVIKDPDEVREAIGITISEAKMNDISEALKEVEDSARLEVPLRTLLGDIRFPKDLPKWIIEAKWHDPVGKIEEDPFCLLQFPRVGFLTCDELRRNLGYPSDFPPRLKHATTYVLDQQNNETWVERPDVLKKMKELLNIGSATGALQVQIDDKVVLEREGYIGHKYHVDCESYLARCIAHLQGGPAHWPTEVSGVSEHQLKCYRHATKNGRFAVLIGGAGTGKTFTGGRMLGNFDPRQIVACAPTGKAANRLTESMIGAGINVQATTIHRTLGCIPMKGRFVFTVEKLIGDILVVDELSMLTNSLACELFSRVPSDMLVLLLGDPYQLPPVGRGTLLRDWQVFCDKTGQGTYGLFTEIRRNGGNLVYFCDKVRKNDKIDIRYEQPPTREWNYTEDNIKFIRSSTSQQCAVKIEKIINDVLDQKIVRADGDPFDITEVQVIVACNDDMHTSKEYLNKKLQDLINPGASEHDFFRIHDKIMCIKNHWVDAGTGRREDDDFIANGEIGNVTETRKKGIDVNMRSGVSARETTRGGRGNYDLAYACTCHKMQGDQAPLVIFVAEDDYKTRRVTSRQWLYTAATRAQELCIVIGTESALKIMMRNDATFKIKSFMVEEMEKQEWSYQGSSSTQENKHPGHLKGSRNEIGESISQSVSEPLLADSGQETTPSKDSKIRLQSNESQSQTLPQQSSTTEIDLPVNSNVVTDYNTLL